jgi:hypothetical protein
MQLAGLMICTMKINKTHVVQFAAIAGTYTRTNNSNQVTTH